jgi:thiol:disulfide interchange protein DsbD
MMMRSRPPASRWSASTALLTVAAILCASPAGAEIESAPVVTDRTRASLVADGAAVAPGASVPITLRLRLKPGWHTYWRNPGDSGEPAAVTLRIDGRELAGPDVWPVPERIEIAGIVSYGHHGDVVLATTVPIAATAKPGTALRVEAEARWLVCEKVCVPEQGRFALILPVGDGAAAGKSGASPLSLPSLPAADAVFARADGAWTLRVAHAPLGAGDAKITDAYFFPERGDQIDHSAPQALRVAEGEIALELSLAQPKPAPPAPPQTLRGVLAVTRQAAGGARHTEHFHVAARPAPDSR